MALDCMYEVSMESWEWEFFETAVTSDLFTVTDQGPLFGPVTDFTIVRDESLDLILETRSASDSTSNAVERQRGLSTRQLTK